MCTVIERLVGLLNYFFPSNWLLCRRGLYYSSNLFGLWLWLWLWLWPWPWLWLLDFL